MVGSITVETVESEGSEVHDVESEGSEVFYDAEDPLRSPTTIDVDDDDMEPTREELIERRTSAIELVSIISPTIDVGDGIGSSHNSSNSVFDDVEDGQRSVHDDPTQWAVSYAQLVEFAAKVKANEGDGKYEAMTMRDINSRYIIPTCQSEKTSFALALNRNGLRSETFVTHSWDELFHSFVLSIDRAYHPKPAKPNLWICAFALRQGSDHVIQEQLEGPLEESPFVVALKASKEFLVVRNNKTDLYSRIWCVCELMYARQAGLVPDNTLVTGPDCFGMSNASCVDAKASDEGDKIRILANLMRHHSVEEIDKFIRWFRSYPKEIDEVVRLRWVRSYPKESDEVVRLRWLRSYPPLREVPATDPRDEVPATDPRDEVPVSKKKKDRLEAMKPACHGWRPST